MGKELINWENGRWIVGIDYKAFEARRAQEKIKQCDLYCAWFEATQTAGFDPVEADKFFITNRSKNISPPPQQEAD